MGDSIARRRYIAAFAIPKTEAENECGSVCCFGRNIFGLLQQVPESLSSGTGCPKLFSLLLYSFRCGRHTWSLGFLSFEKEKSHLHPAGLFCGVIQQMILSEHQSKHLDQYHVFPFEQLFHNHDYKYQNIHDINIRYLLP